MTTLAPCDASRGELKGKVVTVLGPVKPETLGICLAHEHLVIDFRIIFSELPYATDRSLAVMKTEDVNYDWELKHRFNMQDNLLLIDEDEAIKEALLFKDEGGKTIFDVSNRNFARDPLALQRISRRTGLNIVMGGGYFMASAHSDTLKKAAVEETANDFINEIRNGVNSAGVRPGILGEICCGWPLHESERKVLIAAAMTQKVTGIPINVHPGKNDRAPLEIINILALNGAEPSHVTISHTERTLMTHESRVELLKTGCFMLYDSIGREGYFDIDGTVDITNDNGRANDIIRLLDAGFEDQILLSSDICTKEMRVKYGGHGYAHILLYFLPMLRKKGVPEKIVEKLTVHNPARSATYF